MCGRLDILVRTGILTAGVEPGNQEGPGFLHLGLFWYKSKITLGSEFMVQIKLKGVVGVESPSPRSFWCGQFTTGNTSL